jgi:hypothetical protein
MSWLHQQSSAHAASPAVGETTAQSARCCDGNSNQHVSVFSDLHMLCHFLDTLTVLWLCRNLAYNRNLVGTLPASWSALTQLSTLCAHPSLPPMPS